MGRKWSLILGKGSEFVINIIITFFAFCILLGMVQAFIEAFFASLFGRIVIIGVVAIFVLPFLVGFFSAMIKNKSQEKNVIDIEIDQKKPTVKQTTPKNNEGTAIDITPAKK